MEKRIDSLKPTIIAAVVNNNQVEGRPSMPMTGDTSIVPLMRFSDGRNAILPKEALPSLGLEKSEVLDIPIANTKNDEYVIDKMQNILGAISQGAVVPEENDVPMLVVTNKSGMFGAAGFFLNPALDKRDHDPKSGIVVSDFNYTEGLMEELDENDNVIWQATFPSVIHKVYKSTFYDTSADVPNYSYEAFRYIDGQDSEKHLGEKTDIKAIRSALSKAPPLDGSFHVKINRALLSADYDDADEIQLLFVNKAGEGTLYTYKESGTNLPIVNSGAYGIRINGLSGQQKAYVSINGTWYDSGKKYDFSVTETAS